MFLDEPSGIAESSVFIISDTLSENLNKVKKQEGNFVIPLFCCTFAGAIVVKLQV